VGAGQVGAGKLAAEQVGAGEFTVGVEEEYQLIDPDTRALRPSSLSVLPAHSDADERIQPELHTSQIEIGTPICRDLADVRAEVAALRREVIAAAERQGARVGAAGTHPFSRWEDQEITPTERYRMLEDHYQHVARETVTFGSHVHVGIEDPDAVVEIMNRARVWIPPLLALSATSPYWYGADTGYASFRSEIVRRWPLSDVPHRFDSRAEYEALVQDLVAAGCIEDATQIYWDMRPSDRYSTFEFRATDVCMTVDEAVMVAGLVRGLARACWGEAVKGVAPVAIRPELLLAAKWRASRHGLSGELIDPRRSRAVPAAALVGELLDYLRPSLEEAGEFEETSWLVYETLRRGTGAQRQRDAFARSGRLEDVVDLVVEETARSTA
jgi:glutamate---cysteine ligase / carboxylate-amine ligase